MRMERGRNRMRVVRLVGMCVDGMVYRTIWLTALSLERKETVYLP